MLAAGKMKAASASKTSIEHQEKKHEGYLE
jgi:hypothetical protein